MKRYYVMMPQTLYGVITLSGAATRTMRSRAVPALMWKLTHNIIQPNCFQSGSVWRLHYTQMILYFLYRFIVKIIFTQVNFQKNEFLLFLFANSKQIQKYFIAMNTKTQNLLQSEYFISQLCVMYIGSQIV